MSLDEDDDVEAERRAERRRSNMRTTKPAWLGKTPPRGKEVESPDVLKRLPLKPPGVAARSGEPVERDRADIIGIEERTRTRDDRRLVRDLVREPVIERLTERERAAFSRMARDLESGRLDALTPKQRQWARLVSDELSQNVSDIELLDEAIEVSAAQGFEAQTAFEDMRTKLGDRRTLTSDQRDWAEKVAAKA